MDERNPAELLLAIDAARILGLSTDMVRVLVRKGELAATRTANGYFLFQRGDVERLAAKRAGAEVRAGSAARKTRGGR